ncbi:DUF2071 domain-containing protein [Danxiaibacter flavus]|uniref:DUF2071 domain-containing protein n=1 Tax=Danxiaibacter flavus TaxID=3049108 RepID=A0ABV3ZMH4_9BACT|nr:DUF2071 domain-containing protein [Chitinophagaceae bacterium DXS]
MFNITLPVRNADQITIRRSIPWLLHQRWQNVVFFHWKVEPAIIEKYIPVNTEPDLFEDTCWLSIVLFSSMNNHLKKMPSIHILPDFYEINLRTYVVCKRVPGICFLDIKASSAMAVLVNRLLGLPYKKGRFSRLQKTECDDTFYHYNDLNYINTRYKAGSPLIKTAKDLWLTERYVAFQSVKNNTLAFPVAHKPWPLQKMDVSSVDIYWRFKNLYLANSELNCMHFAPAAEVNLWYPQRFNGGQINS